MPGPWPRGSRPWIHIRRRIFYMARRPPAAGKPSGPVSGRFVHINRPLTPPSERLFHMNLPPVHIRPCSASVSRPLGSPAGRQIHIRILIFYMDRSLSSVWRRPRHINSPKFHMKIRLREAGRDPVYMDGAQNYMDGPPSAARAAEIHMKMEENYMDLCRREETRRRDPGKILRRDATARAGTCRRRTTRSPPAPARTSSPCRPADGWRPA